jgi:hypothetical protein
VFGKMCDPVPLRPPEIPDVMPWYRFRAPAVESLGNGHGYTLPHSLNINCTFYIFLVICLNRGTENLKNSNIYEYCVFYTSPD